MAGKRISEEQLNNLIILYAEQKEQLDALKKVCDSTNKEIKETLTQTKSDDGKWEHCVGDIKCVVNTSRKQSFNEEKLLDIIKKSGIKGIVKRREYVDMDALEDAMYKQLIGHDLMMEIDKCREVKETQTLTIRRTSK